MADINKNVGSTAPSQDYATLDLWNAGEGGVDPGEGFKSIATCYGDCGTTTAINGAFIRGAIIQGSIEYDGSNESALPIVDRLSISTSGIVIRDCYIKTNSGSFNAISLSADNVEIYRNRIENTTTSLQAILTNGNYPNSKIHHNVISGGSDVNRVGSGNGCVTYSNIVFGGNDKGYEGGSGGSIGVQFITDTFSFGNAGQDIEPSNFTVATSATEDVSGGTLSGYTSAELFNFAGNDFRTKATSALATAGSGGSFIGAFLESGSGISITPTPITSSESFGNTLVKKSLVVSPLSILSLESFGVTEVIKPIEINVNSFDSSSEFGNASILIKKAINVIGFNSSSVFGKITLFGDAIPIVIKNKFRMLKPILKNVLRKIKGGNL